MFYDMALADELVEWS